MLHRDRVIGVLSLGRSGDEEFTPAQVARLEILVESATLACAEALSLRRLEVLAGELESVMDSTDQGIFRVDLAGRITYINRAALEQTGWTEAGTARPELARRDAPHPYRTARPTRPGVPAAAGGPRRRGGQADRVRCTGARTAAGSRWRPRAYPIRDGDTVIGGVITFHDVSERRMAEHQLAAQYQTARVLAEAESVQEALPRVLELCCDQLGWQMSLVWVPAEDDHELHCLAAYARPGWEEQLALLSHETMTRDRGTAGRAWARGQPVFVPGLDGAVPRQDGPFQNGSHQMAGPRMALRAMVLRAMAGSRMAGTACRAASWPCRSPGTARSWPSSSCSALSSRASTGCRTRSRPSPRNCLSTRTASGATPPPRG